MPVDMPDAIAHRILKYFAENARELPWRNPPGQALPLYDPQWPYRVWLSEIMLQQTTVAAVKPYFAAFINRWPSISALATAADDKKTVAALQAIGLPPRTDPRAFGVLRRAIRAYEGKVATPAPRAWWQPESRYSSAQALETYEQGEDYSFLQFVGPNGDGIFSKVDLPRLGVRFDIPVYLVQGQEDLLTPLSVTQIYFDSLQAPDKILVVVPKAGHDPNEALLAAQYQVLMEQVTPKTRRAD